MSYSFEKNSQLVVVRVPRGLEGGVLRREAWVGGRARHAVDDGLNRLVEPLLRLKCSHVRDRGLAQARSIVLGQIAKRAVVLFCGKAVAPNSTAMDCGRKPARSAAPDNVRACSPLHQRCLRLPQFSRGHRQAEMRALPAAGGRNRYVPFGAK